VQNPRYRAQEHSNWPIIKNLRLLVVSPQNITLMAAILNFQPFDRHIGSWKLFFWTQHILKYWNQPQDHPNRPIIKNSMNIYEFTPFEPPSPLWGGQKSMLGTFYQKSVGGIVFRGQNYPKISCQKKVNTISQLGDCVYRTNSDSIFLPSFFIVNSRAWPSMEDKTGY